VFVHKLISTNFHFAWDPPISPAQFYIVGRSQHVDFAKILATCTCNNYCIV